MVPPKGASPLNGIAEWTLTIDGVDRVPGSVWEAVNITLELSPPAGGTPYYAAHRGFLYDAAAPGVGYAAAYGRAAGHARLLGLLVVLEAVALASTAWIVRLAYAHGGATAALQAVALALRTAKRTAS